MPAAPVPPRAHSGPRRRRDSVAGTDAPPRVCEGIHLRKRRERVAATLDPADHRRERVGVQRRAVAGVRADVHEDDLSRSKASQDPRYNTGDGLPAARSEPPARVHCPADSGIAQRVDDPQRPTTFAPVRKSEQRLRFAARDPPDSLLSVGHFAADLRIREAVQIEMVHRVVADRIVVGERSRPPRIEPGEVAGHEESGRHSEAAERHRDLRETRVVCARVERQRDEVPPSWQRRWDTTDECGRESTAGMSNRMLRTRRGAARRDLPSARPCRAWSNHPLVAAPRTSRQAYNDEC